MTEHVLFYSLNKKFVEQENDIPEHAQQVMYYSLAIGHHVGVIDCFQAVINCPIAQYKQWIDYIEDSREAHAKLDRLFKFGEITVDISHVNLLANAFLAKYKLIDEPFKTWTDTLLSLFQAMTKEPAMYLMIKHIGRN
ncbi:formate hydrogenlyase maturation HycH family protein [Orbus wheelerorum]|uniref:formate hydrogenlyase maturation HycH family protein n=1 Tax=Orbus wheelerorum TaxID=3074111 RepID=UPI00370D0874